MTFPVKLSTMREIGTGGGGDIGRKGHKQRENLREKSESERREGR